MLKRLQEAYKGSPFNSKSNTLLLDEDKIYDGVALAYQFGGTLLLDITVIDYLDYPSPAGSRFGLVYIIRHKDFKEFVVLKTYLSEPVCQSVTSIYKAADWLERECYDQYGVNFENHPNLERILNHWQFDGHPLRRDYPITKGQLCTDAQDLMPQMNQRLYEKNLICKK